MRKNARSQKIKHDKSEKLISGHVYYDIAAYVVKKIHDPIKYKTTLFTG